MGFFSYKTSDTNKSIPNIYSGKEPVPVKILWPHTNEITISRSYAGYGVFNGNDVFASIAIANGFYAEILGRPEEENQENARTAFFLQELPVDLDALHQKGLKVPKIASLAFTCDMSALPGPQNCEHQGYFY